jgi:threonine dehydratase
VIARHLPPTPLRPSLAGGDRDLWLKLECWQPTGSFKVRGALNVLASLPPEAARRGVVAASAGNHALGVAWAAGALGGTLDATLFVPQNASRAKVDKLRRFPVTVVERGADYDDAYAAAVADAERRGALYVHAFEDVLTAAGQGTAALEIEEALPDVGSLLVPVGGGGLLSGCVAALKARRPDVRVIAVQPSASPALRESLRLGRPLLVYPAAPTLADPVAGGIGALVFLHRDLIDEVVTVSEREIERAIAALAAHDQVIAEAAGALGVAALLAGRVRAGGRPLVTFVSGGNLDAHVLARVLSENA